MKDLSDLTTQCIRCGFCLESCPTFKVTGDETESPRGRIYLVRSAVEGKLDWKDDVAPHLDACLGCRNCETACPSGVEYGSIFEQARARIEQELPRPAKRAFLTGLTRPGLLRVQLVLGKLWPGSRVPAFFAKLLGAASVEAELPVAQVGPVYPPLQEASLPPVRGEVYMLRGCVMRVLYDPVNEATRRLLRRVGYVVREVDDGCCGALHAHNGCLTEAQDMAKKLAAQFPGDLPIVVNSAGCGSTMKEYNHLIGDESFAARAVDISEFLVREGLIDALRGAPGIDATLTYHDACHLAHGQRVTQPPRDLLAAIPRAKVVPLGESDLCCGSAGIYNILQPEMARTLLNRKWKNVELTQATLVATGNPGCHAWIAQAARENGRRVEVLHTVEVLERAFLTSRV